MRKDASSTAADGTMFERYHTQFYRERELRTMRPIIGIPCFAAARAGTGRQIYGCNQAYVRAVVRAGGAPLLIPPMDDAESLAAIRAQLDGLLLSGGGDLDPALYGETPLPESQPPEHERDTMELAITRWALDVELPIFGVCRGMQLLNVVRGGSLYQHLPAQHPSAIDHEQPGEERAHIAHDIRVQPGSLLAGILGSERASVNSFHHQAVNRVGKGFVVTAVAEDGIAEGMELPDAPFVLAVQYHPEELEVEDEASRKLFAAFVRACSERKQTKQASVK